MDEKINNWEILEYLGNGVYLCRCLICNESLSKKSKYNMRNSNSCGCTKREKYLKIGDKINNWTILDRTDAYGVWKAQCQCGAIRSKDGNSLKVDKSCGCLKNELRKQTNLEKYGVEHHSQAPAIKEKAKETHLRKYGEYFNNRHQARQTNLEKYGVENISQLEATKEKKKHTTFKNFGVENYLGTSEQLSKAREACLKKYGAEYFFQTNIGKKAQKQGMMDRYGVRHPMQLLEIQEKIKQTNLERYGFDNYSKTPMKRNQLKEWCEENPEKLYCSKAEQEILSWIQSFYPNTHKIKQEGNELDMFIPELHLGVEHNGLFWHSEQNKPNDYHLDKTNYFAFKNIRTIHIWEHEWKKRQEQVKSFLLSALNKNEYKIGARKCRFLFTNDPKEIKAAQELLEATHIQGKAPNPKYVTNVYYNDMLIATATFSKHHRNSTDWVLSRFTTKTNYTIQGALAKISKLASKELKSDIISWADYRLSQGNGYLKAGWVQEELLKPDYFYFKDNKVYSKQSRQKKKVGTPEGMTEHEHALLDGLLRVYDCGKIRFRYKYEGELRI